MHALLIAAIHGMALALVLREGLLALKEVHVTARVRGVRMLHAMVLRVKAAQRFLASHLFVVCCSCS